MLGVIVRPYPALVAGTPTSYSFDAATRRFTLDFAPDSSVSAPTRIIVPQRTYPSGFTVECDCSYETDGDELVITKAPGGRSATITVRP